MSSRRTTLLTELLRPVSDDIDKFSAPSAKALFTYSILEKENPVKKQTFVMGDAPLQRDIPEDQILPRDSTMILTWISAKRCRTGGVCI
jgi:hypothetical protein